MNEMMYEEAVAMLVVEAQKGIHANARFIRTLISLLREHRVPYDLVFD